MLNDYIKTLPQFILPKHLLTHFAGLLANVRSPAVKNLLIRNFIQQYRVNMQEAQEENFEKYNSFNEFFIRPLKPECRPLAAADIVSPVDGFISEIGTIEQGQILQAKGRYYTVEQLLACEQATTQQFIHGRFATLYLSPKDYHRIHMPIDAILKEMIYVPGKLFSVQPTTARVIPHLFARNERLICFFDTRVGPMAMVLVGATIVGAIGTQWHGDLKRSRKKQIFSHIELAHLKREMKQGEEMGYFKLGSTVILLFSEGDKVQWLDNLAAGQSICYGQAFGKIKQDLGINE
ncbi:archaetidylserine decarboxylase [Legionella cardiaca]|uniref:Phosphatidylserine decarboxylase proenzyme n=1 Tax=Legionella cardiaca TaxID=1071983 RepID=A0ABY8ARY5_9GAMM|nr:archaetidylserine decarboxylase [Legionella cardiaca]WED42971.1 archaetidylserine decarboxylase [Legionella cardiaca]